MMPQWRLFIVALRFVTATTGTNDTIPSPVASRFVPLAGIAVALGGAAVYWLGAQLWPTSIAVVLAMLATFDARMARGATVHRVFFLLLKYNALMALSSAKLPFTVPDYMTLGIIMICGQAASRALVVSVMATDLTVPLGLTALDLGIALAFGLIPAALLGIPGLIGLVAAIAVRLGLRAYPLTTPLTGLMERLDIAQQLTELCFYLGALAAWRYI